MQEEEVNDREEDPFHVRVAAQFSRNKCRQGAIQALEIVLQHERLTLLPGMARKRGR
jgi:hypothetical protein